MKCINKIAAFICAFSLLFLLGCSGAKYDYAYDINNKLSAYSLDTSDSARTLVPFANDLCVSDSNYRADSVDMTMAYAAGLFDTSMADTLYAKNINDKMNPASLTKVMTALLALKYGNLEDTLTASSNIKFSESGVQVCGFKEGDKISLEQALYGLLVYSGNDVAVMIAEYISGSVDSFSQLMNDEAKSLGATNTHFTNPHGLTDENHYTTAYDLYLIFNEAIKYPKFVEIINRESYEFTYHDRDGNDKNMKFDSTNLFSKGDKKAPGWVTVIGGKTGTTKAAGSCLILLSKDSGGSNYISVILKATDRDTLYTEMEYLLKDIPQ